MSTAERISWNPGTWNHSVVKGRELIGPLITGVHRIYSCTQGARWHAYACTPITISVLARVYMERFSRPHS